MKLWNHAHAVSRWHTVPGGNQNLADHSWGVALIVARYFMGRDSEKVLLLRAALEHDLAEALVGDVPKYARTREHSSLEYDEACAMGLTHVNLPLYLENWLKWADLLEAGLYAQHQVKLGNAFFAQVVTNVSNNLSGERGACCPLELMNLAKENDLCL